ncbi:MAG: GNAT family N-acetyltransferase, partial [Bacillota bacterium]|nr:GNAT family N-acetyltransferase [Bacillota bacterium]
YWIYEGGKRIGGVLMRPNLLTGLFVEPPFTDINRVLGSLVTTVKEWSDPALPIRAYGIVQWQYEAFTRHGFRIIEGRRNMIRPTEILPYEFAEEFEIMAAREEYEVQTAELLHAAFDGGAGIPMTLAQHVETARDFYGTFIKKSEVMARASSLVFNRATGELVALCHVREWEGWPMIDDIVVRPQYQGRGLATALLRKAISEVAPHYPAIRLFVTVGNSAQSVYYNLGFIPGSEFYELEIPARV